VFWTESKSSNRTAPGTELVIAPRWLAIVTAFAGLTASDLSPGNSSESG
jgi:hypothetical protein